MKISNASASLQGFMQTQRNLLLSIAALATAAFASAFAQTQSATGARFSLPTSGVSLQRALTSGAFFDVVGRRSAAFGYEGRPLEVWVYPLKVLDDLQFRVQLDGYPVPMSANELPGTIEVRPEATILTWSHAAFTVKQIVFAPIDEPAIVVLLDIDTVLPMTVTGSFRPVLHPMWPAAAATANAGWDTAAHAYELSEESGRFAARIVVPGGVDRSLMPYQEEPRDVPLEFSIEVAPDRARREFIPIVIAGTIDGRAAARTASDRILAGIPAQYKKTVEHYRTLLDTSTVIDTPDPRVNRGFEWAVIGMDKGFATNPALGPGLVAGFRTSGNSERPGFAWFFGRDALWTSLALTASGRSADVKTALEFLAKFQREDGKIPHEISQSATLVPWFTDFPYAWASADATPLYVIAHADLWRTGGDRAFLERHWPSILKAYRFSAATDADGNGLIDNTGVGHGWVEGGALSPPHEEIYQQGLWIQASHDLAAMAEVMGDRAAATTARAAAERTREAVENTYWLTGASHYAFATQQPRRQPAVAEPGPNRDVRQRRLDALASARLIDEDTILPAVPMWWRALDRERADAELDRIGSASLATDWGLRILSNASQLYDPLSYHYGSVWPLFTGWAAMAAYRYGRPHVGFQALNANVLLTESGALGYITELLSGDVNAPFGRSSHHQVWSEAMVAGPLIRGLLGIEPLEGGTRLRVAPQLPADWNRASVRGVECGGYRFDVDVTRGPGLLTVRATRRQQQRAVSSPPGLTLAPAFPLDARIMSVVVNGRPARASMTRIGDVQFAEIAAAAATTDTVAQFRYEGGSDVYLRTPMPAPGARSEGIRILRSRADDGALARGSLGEGELRLLVEGRGGRSYDLFLRSSKQVANVRGATLVSQAGGDPIVRVTFEGAGEYSRRDVVVELRR
jgi:glycogen debranching enzyme